MTPPAEDSEDAMAQGRVGGGLAEMNAQAGGEPISVANEFAEVRVRRVHTRNGARLLIESPKSGRWIALCPLELEALTWQSTATFSAMVGNPFASLVPDDTEASDEDARGAEDRGDRDR